MPTKKNKPSYYNPWHYHPANNTGAAQKIAKTLQKQGKDVRIRPATKKSGYTVWERD